jgi:hypothetical protein
MADKRARIISGTSRAEIGVNFAKLPELFKNK